MSEQLHDFAAAIKYRPRYLRDMYDFEGAMDAYLRACDMGYQANMREFAFVFGESASSWFTNTPNADIMMLHQALEIVAEALKLGYDHGRNISAWVICRSLTDPAWLETELLPKFPLEGDGVNLMRLLDKEAVRQFSSGSTEHDALFGIDEAEFWNLLGRACRNALHNPDRAIEYYRSADRYSGTGGNFTTRVGLARSHLAKGDWSSAQRYYRSARGIARAFHAPALDQIARDIQAIAPLANQPP
jgi:hypothetical protein